MEKDKPKQMAIVLPEEIETYVSNHASPESALLRQIADETTAEVPMPQMLSGTLQGTLLATFSQMLRPRRILEIGTFTAYSALCLAQGLAEDGKLITIDNNKALETRVRTYLAQSPQKAQIDYRIGDALTVIDTIDDIFDLVFIDADKVNYLRYYEKTLPMVRKGGFIIADNVLWKGKVSAHKQPSDKKTQALHAFNTHLTQDKRVKNFILPIRDGLMIAQKY